MNEQAPYQPNFFEKPVSRRSAILGMIGGATVGGFLAKPLGMMQESFAHTVTAESNDRQWKVCVTAPKQSDHTMLSVHGDHIDAQHIKARRAKKIQPPTKGKPPEELIVAYSNDRPEIVLRHTNFRKISIEHVGMMQGGKEVAWDKPVRGTLSLRGNIGAVIHCADHMHLMINGLSDRDVAYARHDLARQCRSVIQSGEYCGPADLPRMLLHIGKANLDIGPGSHIVLKGEHETLDIGEFMQALPQVASAPESKYTGEYLTKRPDYDQGHQR